MSDEKQSVVMYDRDDLSPQQLIARAIDKGTDVGVMERLFALAREWKAMAARDAYFQALSGFQAECPIIAKTKIVKDRSGKERYRYAPLDDIVAQLRDLLKKHGFSYTIDTEQPEGKLIAYCDSHHVAGHSERTRLEVPVGSEFMSAQQMVGAARTYAMRYVFCNAFGILTGDEDNDATTTDDGDKAVPETTPDGTPGNPFKCPECGKFAVIKGAPQYGGGWVCWKKKDGCGKKWDDLAWAAATSAGPSVEAQEAVMAADADPLVETAKRVFKGTEPAKKSTKPSADDEAEARTLF